MKYWKQQYDMGAWLMINVLEPRSELLKQFVDSIYVFKKGETGFEFTAYPNVNTAVGLMRHAAVTFENGCVCISHSPTAGYKAMVCNQFSTSIHLKYLQSVDEIAINFKPLGFSSYTQSKPNQEHISVFGEWDRFLPDLFQSVFATEDPDQQLEYIERHLLRQYKALSDESILLKALELLHDASRDYKMQEIADLVGIHYKQLYRSFTEHVGCSPVHFRKLVKFRSSVISKIQKGNQARLVDICYNHNYIDQPYFTKQFKELTGEKPSLFFKEITSFGADRLIFKMD